MFDQASNFNQPLNNWTVSSVENVSFMFSDATRFNQPLNFWNIRSVTDMASMFNGASSFNQNLCIWYNVSYSIIPINVSLMFYHTGRANLEPNFDNNFSFCSSCIEVSFELVVA
jgi:hypothetical protein